MANVQSSHIRFFYRTRESSLASHLFEFIRLYLYALYGFIHYLCPNAIVWLSYCRRRRGSLLDMQSLRPVLIGHGIEAMFIASSIAQKILNMDNPFQSSNLDTTPSNLLTTRPRPFLIIRDRRRSSVRSNSRL